MTTEELNRRARAWQRHFVMRDLFVVLAAVLGLGAVGALWISPARLLPFLAPVFIGLLFACFSFRWRRPVSALQLTRHLDRSFPQLEESAALWLRAPESLTLIERLQRQRIDAAAQRLSAEGENTFAAPVSAQLKRPVIWASAGLVIFVLVSGWSLFRQPPDKVTNDGEAAETVPAVPAAAVVPPKVTSAEMLIVPPAYTGRTERRVAGLNAEIEEGAAVTWSIAFDQTLYQPHFVFGGSARESLPLEAIEHGSFRGTRAIAETTLYQLKAVLSEGTAWNSAEIHSLKVLKDRPPSLQIAQPAAPRTEIASQAAASQVAVEVMAADDYGISDAHLIATVAKGTGEAVKFREQKIAFDRNSEVEPGTRSLTKTLDLIALGLEPGDELYFHVEAADNRQPTANRARSETRFLVLKGAEQTVSTPGAGVAGIHLLPQYFRSQRQIIIDTEKLIAERASLPVPEFRERANNLGIDQQLLRQRYGQFVGEEEHFDGDGHEHTEPVGQASGALALALAAMWEAERFLRVAQPDEALAPENRALELLKELQQADRAYVQRVGFDAAPLDQAGRRMRGDVSTVPQRRLEEAGALPEDERFSATRELLRLSPWRRSAGGLSAEEVELIRKVEPSLVSAATETPERFLAGLQELQRLQTGRPPADVGRSQLEQALLRLLPNAQPRPVQATEVSAPLANEYFRNLEGAR